MIRAWLLLAVWLLSACASSPPPRPTTVAPKPAPSVITGTTFDDGLRHFLGLQLNDPARVELRERLVTHLLSVGPEPEAQDAYEALVDHFYEVTRLYTPQEIAAGQLPPGLAATARELYAKGSPRGDEARVLSALLVLRALRPDDAEPREMYDRIKEWTFDSRAALSAPLERFQEGLSDVWEEHARLTPTPEVLAQLTRLYVERRDELVRLFQSGGRPLPDSAAVFEGVRDTAVAVAAVYLRVGDIQGALSNVQALGSSVGVEARLAEYIEQAQEQSPEGTTALLELIRRYHEGGLNDVARGLALTGLRERPYEPAFPVRLGHIAADNGDFAQAMGWYADAVRLAPDDRAVYDQVLDVLNGLMEQGLFGSDLEQARVIGNRAAQILEERLRRWPEPPPPVKPEELYLALGNAEMNAGHPEAAEQRLRAGLQAQDSVAGRLQLGFLLLRTGRAHEAAEVYRHALSLLEAREAEPPRRAEALENLGDALRIEGKLDEADKAYGESLALWDASMARLRGRRLGVAQLRRGVLLGRIGRREEARSAFERAMELAPEVRETYATILQQSLVEAPDAAFAHRVLRLAQNQLSLDPEWKVYFALWVRAIAQRSGADVEDDVKQLLAEMALGHDWFGKLAQFASGKLDYAGLLAAAQGVGQRTEAHFYEAMRRLGAGDAAGGYTLLQSVLDTRMVAFYEFAMAQELMAAARQRGAAQSQAVATPAPLTPSLTP